MEMWFVWVLNIAAILLLPPVLYLVLTKGRGDWSRSLRGAGLILAGTYTLLFGTFMAGETVTDPSGWAAAGGIAAWLAPVIGLAFLAWYRPKRATMVFTVLLAGVVGMYVWSAIAQEAWRSFEDSIGPIRAIVSFAMAVPLSLLGWKRPAVGGAMLVALPVLPAILAVIAAAGGTTAAVWAIAVVTAPPGVTGILYLLSTARWKGAPPKPEERSASPWAKAA